MKGLKGKSVVADAGPLIGLAVIGATSWLKSMFGKIMIPEQVAVELRFDSGMPGSQELHKAHQEGWLIVVPVYDIPEHLVAAIDGGEAAAITLAKNTNALLLTDENRGRMVARKHGVTVFGSGAVLLKAKELQIIPRITPYLDALQRSGYRLSATLQNELLKRAGEN